MSADKEIELKKLDSEKTNTIWAAAAVNWASDAGFEWTQNAINSGFRGQVREEFQILTFAQDGLITGPGGGKFGSSGFSINCTIVQRLN